MLDLKGPDLSVCKFTGGTAYLTEGTKIRIYEEEVMGDSTKFSVNYKEFVKKVFDLELTLSFIMCSY